MVMVQPPTACLPPVAQLATSTTTQLSDSLQYLHSLYLPQVRGSRRRRRDDRSYPASLLDDDDDDDQLVQSDAFERAYAIHWLTALIAHLETRQDPTIDTGRLTQRAAPSSRFAQEKSNGDSRSNRRLLARYASP